MYRPPMLHYTPPKCPDCNGTGRLEFEGLMPRTCDRCNGQGTYTNPVALIVGLALIVITTLVPLGLIWLIN